MAISAKTLFHFTKDICTIKSVLEIGFWPRYCKEDGWGKDKDISWAVPIVCFTDIPLSKINNHIYKYGSFGIGMKREWVREQKDICPVWYLNQMSIDVVNQLRNALQERNIPAHYRLFSLLKKTEGEKNYYYDEREWRYIPNVNDKKLCFINLQKHPMNEEELKKESEKTKTYCLRFGPEDIQYLIIDDESNRSIMIDIIKQIYTDEKTVEVLSSKIISKKQIEEDF